MPHLSVTPKKNTMVLEIAIACSLVVYSILGYVKHILCFLVFALDMSCLFDDRLQKKVV